LFLNVLGLWLRGLISILIFAVGVGLIAKWFDDLPRDARTVSPNTGAVTVRPLDTLTERLEARELEGDRPIGFLVAGIGLLSWSMLGRFLTPILWCRRGPRRPSPQPRVDRRVATRHGYSLHVEEHGRDRATPLVLVHGLGSDRTQWREAVEDLGDRFRIVTLDLLGHGRSAHVDGAEHTLEAAAEDLDDVLQDVALDGAVLVGHSMGGMIAMTWCLAHPERAARLGGLVLAHTTPQNPFETMSPAALHRALQPVYPGLLRAMRVLAPLVRLGNLMSYWNGSSHWHNDLTAFGGRETREQLDRVSRLMARLDPRADARFARAMMAFDVRSRLRGLAVPTLVVIGRRDGTTLPEAGETIVQRIPGAERLVLDDMKHLGFMEERRRFAEAVARFATPVPARARRGATG
jgi:pimeloyl-ACP methyl ester carboxylesterase